MASSDLPSRTVKPKHDESRTMKAIAWMGKKSVHVSDKPVPLITDPHDAIIKVTATAICGSDLHIFVNAMPGMTKGDILGHEFMGIVQEVGPEVTKFKPGDKVVACFDLGCGQCFYCKRGLWSCCQVTNPSKEQEAMYGDRTAGMHGYSAMTGAYEGGQAEYARVIFADVNLLKVPNDAADEKYLFLSDILPTAWHATELGEVSEGDTVAIWGAGPVGILAAHCAAARGAKRIIMVDNQTYRLDFATSKIPGLETVNFGEKKVMETLKEMTGGHGPDVAIEAVGFHYCKSWTHAIETALMLETDPSEMLNEMIVSVRKGGRISIVGVYAGFTNHFNIGAFMEKQLTMRGGQTPVQKYWHDLKTLIDKGVLDPTMVLTHTLPLDQGPEGYKIFNDKTDGCVKVVLKPQLMAAGA
ncbi:Sorbitol dehydrogenase [Klebsormidium nitens]|uniref:Sorbitol dehydrogenase n=1 Tax=Klebsormidium nitens TaxID=105231 RepID=A0A1Y1I4J5_KLENI|nr:Sorbitol dehydrogenase [Klebsormidium nitens]|eukprot:GAQ85860.1 Sorbitol dehydrogenase [Klebsormidium nitens]